ncbi:MAG: nucleotide exchange factor GrpE, partial [Nanoarchaeota archaeon]
DIESIKKQAEEYLNGWKRAKADYLNLKKEIESQNKEIKEWLSKIMLLPLLGIMDSFDKAFNTVSEDLKNTPWFIGIEGIKKQFEEYLKTQGVESMVVKDEKFDPTKHEAVESTEGDESGKVAEELQKGYLINSEVLRPAKVKVYK